MLLKIYLAADMFMHVDDYMRCVIISDDTFLPNTCKDSVKFTRSTASLVQAMSCCQLYITITLMFISVVLSTWQTAMFKCLNISC